MSGKRGRYDGRRSDSPPAFSAAATLQLLAVCAVSRKRDVLSTSSNVENA